MAAKVLSESTTSLEVVDFIKIENTPWGRVQEVEKEGVQVSTDIVAKEIHNFVQNIFVDEEEEDITLWSDDGGISNEADPPTTIVNNNISEDYHSDILEHEIADWNTEHSEYAINNNDIPPEHDDPSWNRTCGVEFVDNTSFEHSTWNSTNPADNCNTFENKTWTIMCPVVDDVTSVGNTARPEGNFYTVPCDDENRKDEEEVSVWTDDGATIMKINQNEIIYMDAGTKIEKIIQNLDMIESDVDIPSRTLLLIVTLRGLTKELQSIINDRAQKVDQLEMQCESQEILIKSHREENEFILERIDNAMRELEKTISEQYKRIDQLDKHSVTQDILADNQNTEKQKLIDRIKELEKSLNLSQQDKALLCEKLITYEKKCLISKKDKDILAERLFHVDVLLDRQTSDKELLLERIVNLEVELDDLMNNHKEEKGLLIERINNLEMSLHANNCVLSHDLKKEIVVVNTELNTSHESKIPYKQTIAMETSHNGNNIYAYANSEAAINVIHNMLHKDKLTKLI